ncbi:MAG TPA: hypothetical protein PK402_13355, partial [Tepidisphaeraceae bacterium]|nr:hypothetical protein [Tepidisphaeraceae bacterium]
MLEGRRHLSGEWFWPHDVVNLPSWVMPAIGGDNVITVVPGTVANTWDVYMDTLLTGTSPADITSMQIADGNGNDVV